MDDKGNLASFSKAPGTFNRPFDKDGARAFAALSAQVRWGASTWPTCLSCYTCFQPAEDWGDDCSFPVTWEIQLRQYCYTPAGLLKMCCLHMSLSL
jgi:hypothetical protein